MKTKNLAFKAKSYWRRHGWKLFGPLVIVNIKYYFKRFLKHGSMRFKKSALDEIPGVETSSAVYLSALGYSDDFGAGGHAYEPIENEDFEKALELLSINLSDFHFVDLGSGNGRALFLASKAGFRKVTGVEFSGELHNLAQKNIDAAAASGMWPNTDRIEIFHDDAANYEPPKTPLVLYLFNPFDAIVMAKVVERWTKSMATHSHDLWVMYNNPTEAAFFSGHSDFQYISSVAGFSIFRRKSNAEK